MKIEDGQLQYYATDLANFLACKHATELDRAAAENRIKREQRNDPVLDLLIELGERHEAAVISYMKDQHKSVIELRQFEDPDGEKTLTAMREGIDVIVQGSLRDNPWGGRADFLLKVDHASELGAWSYEVADAKLSDSTKASAVLQLCLYTSIVSKLQGRQPPKRATKQHAGARSATSWSTP